ncbi:hypothetical protein CkaCkLH20_07681 [Colletotrichum karsti]|uniref:Uncharacterized protein n=1 Tax=Colletotrichum karsti TaxID=1095194 RepID=A0A9P6I3A5_9PEZI|nr:uncharacterized protein CkaCkLH20_07681 [Colletotrichum karsti]KAF9874987.1 hypothetical protein CkaCkLH20_07681 [Colletotrichum karsti]
MVSLTLIVLTIAGLCVSFVCAVNTPVSKDNIHIGDKDWEWWFAEKGSPMFHFALANGNSQCYPTWPWRPDGSKTPPAEMDNWPNIRGCKKPDNNLGFKYTWGVPMPVYFTVRECENRSRRGNGTKEVRVTYGLFYEKDGFFSNGHDYDWENVVVTWRQFGDNFLKDEIWVSAHHGGKKKIGWENVPQTADPSNWLEDGGKNNDHARVYVGWCKHAMFFDRAGIKDVLSCLTDLEYRTHDWYYVARNKSDLLNASPGTKYWDKFVNEEWGKAWSKPSNEYWASCDR